MGGIVHKSGLIADGVFADLSIVIITLNEEKNLPSLLATVPKAAEIIVLDSGSTDLTTSIAKDFGARTEFRDFDNYASQKNYAMSLSTRGWTLFLDADEVPDPSLWQAIGRASSKPADQNLAYELNRRLVFLGRKMRFGRTRDRVVRLFKSHSAAYQNEIHETLVVAPEVTFKCLDGVLWHHSYDDLDDYFSKFNRYTSMMATTRWRDAKVPPSVLIIAARLPLDFLIRYIVKLGFLDGWPGFLWASLSSFYSLVKYAKLKEISDKVSR
jgi:glycosyltransferase involved in cell wall biosynthesis